MTETPRRHRLPFLAALRPHQWVKNLFVVAPLVFAQDITDVPRLGRAALAFALFCGLSGAVYLLNDLCDIEADRAHPVKRFRPIASGALDPRAAWAELVVLILIVAAAGTLRLGGPFTAIAGAYLGTNLLYSFRLKHVAYVDVLLIALGFVFRVLAGGEAAQVPISAWVLVCTFLLALFLGFGKRYHELMTLTSGVDIRRRALLGYSARRLRRALHVLGFLTAAAYLAYTLTPATMRKLHTGWLWITTPCILVGLWRFFSLTATATSAESPTERMIRDPIFIANLSVWGALILFLLY